MVFSKWMCAQLIVLALANPSPTSTVGGLDAHKTLTQAPPPTRAPQHALPQLLARSYSPYSITYGVGDAEVCGYMTHDPLQPIACYASELCSGSSSAFVCCSSSSVSTSNGVYLTQGLNCTPWAYTECYPSSATASCTDSACLATATACTDPEFPQCFTVGAMQGFDLAGPVFGKDDGNNLTAVWCDVISTSVVVEQNWLFTYLTSVSSVSPSSTGPLAQTPGPTESFSASQAGLSSDTASAGGSQATASASQDSKGSRRWSDLGLVMSLSGAIGFALIW